MATQKTATTPPAPPSNTAVANPQPTISERFTNKVIQEFGSSVTGAYQVTDAQRRLIQGYFIKTDQAMKLAEENRLRKNTKNTDHKWDNPLPCTWENIKLDELALDLMHYARMGLDMMQDNHLFPIPYRDNKANKYDITLMPGYNGIRYMAEKYAVNPPLAVITELVFSTDTFQPIKKSASNPVEGYEFSINNPFDRGEVVGGFGYIAYADPALNKLVIMSLKDILKRKPSNAAAEFWGGKKAEWDNGKKSEVEVEGWFEEMCLKTLKREIYSAKYIPRDPAKIDETYQYVKNREIHYAQLQAQAEIDAEANTIDITPSAPEAAPAVVDRETGEILPPSDAAGGPDF